MQLQYMALTGSLQKQRQRGLYIKLGRTKYPSHAATVVLLKKYLEESLEVFFFFLDSERLCQ